jgi:preprotein translocase subunit SecD
MKKTIIYVLVALMMGSMFASALPFTKDRSSNILVLQCTDATASIELLNQAAKIMESRLITAGIKSDKLKVSEEDRTIEVSLNDEADLKQASKLLSAKGTLGFYETADRDEVYKVLGENHPMIKLLHIRDGGHVSSAVFGHCDEDNIHKVNKMIQEMDSPELKNAGVIFAWGAVTIGDNARELFLLKGASKLCGSQVEKARVKGKRQSGNSYLLMNLDKDGGEKFEELTAQNITKPVAIVLDHMVYSAPIVQESIKGGKCAISGKFTAAELGVLAAIIGNGELPLNFEVIN